MRWRPMVLIVAIAAVVGGGTAAVLWKSARDPAVVMPQSQPARKQSVARELAYVSRYWQHGDIAAYGEFGGTDCVNFVSQALLARGWRMTPGWAHSLTDGVNAYTKSWVSSTAFMRYVAAHPALAVAVTDAHRDRLAVGDVVQFDWDDSGDRDHTAIVQAIEPRPDGHIEVYIAEHSPNAWHVSVDRLLGEHRHAVAHYWHLRD